MAARKWMLAIVVVLSGCESARLPAAGSTSAIDPGSTGSVVAGLPDASTDGGDQISATSDGWPPDLGISLIDGGQFFAKESGPIVTVEGFDSDGCAELRPTDLEPRLQAFAMHQDCDGLVLSANGDALLTCTIAEQDQVIGRVVSASNGMVRAWVGGIDASPLESGFATRGGALLMTDKPIDIVQVRGTQFDEVQTARPDRRLLRPLGDGLDRMLITSWTDAGTLESRWLDETGAWRGPPAQLGYTNYVVADVTGNAFVGGANEATHEPEGTWFDSSGREIGPRTSLESFEVPRPLVQSGVIFSDGTWLHPGLAPQHSDAGAWMKEHGPLHIVRSNSGYAELLQSPSGSELDIVVYDRGGSACGSISLREVSPSRLVRSGLSKDGSLFEYASAGQTTSWQGYVRVVRLWPGLLR